MDKEKKLKNSKMMLVAAVIFAVLTIVSFNNGNKLVGWLFLIATVGEVISSILLRKDAK